MFSWHAKHKRFFKLNSNTFCSFLADISTDNHTVCNRFVSRFLFAMLPFHFSLKPQDFAEHPDAPATDIISCPKLTCNGT